MEEKVLDRTGYHLVFEDDFDGGHLDRTKWNVELHEPKWVNDEVQSYVDREENIYLKDGKLFLQGVKDSKGNITSGRINTSGKHEFTYGLFEASLKFPKGTGFFPAFWLLGDEDIPYGPWPDCGEIDITEVLGDETSKGYSTIHYDEAGHKQSQGTYFTEESQPDFSESYHKFSCEWLPGQINYYVDDRHVFTASGWKMIDAKGDPKPSPAPYDHNFYIILNLAFTGPKTWEGHAATDKDLDFGQTFSAEYVRVYQKDSY